MPSEELKEIIAKVANEKNTTKKKDLKTLQVVVFELDSEEYAVEITDLREIIHTQAVTPVPNSPEFIKGILNLRGKIVVVIDLEKRFGLVRENKLEPKHIIITEINGSDFGVIVDSVKEVLKISVDNIRPTPELVTSKIHAEYINGVVVFGNEEEADTSIAALAKPQNKSRLLVLLDLPKLLQDKELLQLGEVVHASV